MLRRERTTHEPGAREREPLPLHPGYAAVQFVVSSWPWRGTIEIVDKCFCHDIMEQIVDSLERVASETNDAWCISTLNRLKEASPLSLKVSLRSIREGRF
ncbi:hypothetical protein HN51_047436 [Arachis hypogaea]